MVGYSDTSPYEVIRVVSDKCLEIRSMIATKNPDFKPDFEVGGFSAHCTNNHDQKWLITSDPNGHTIKVRKRKTVKNYGEGIYWNNQARYRLANEPHKFYDYNF